LLDDRDVAAPFEDRVLDLVEAVAVFYDADTNRLVEVFNLNERPPYPATRGYTVGRLPTWRAEGT